jgi:type IV secretory pathway protease TraF
MTTTAAPDAPRPILKRADVLFAGILCALFVATYWCTINISPSVPYGLYRFLRTETPFQRGDIVQIPAVPFGRPWLHSWWPLLKPVAGVEGDVVCILAGRLDVNGVDYGPVYEEHKGKPLPVFWGCHVVGAGEIFVASHAPKSLDGCYVGMTRIEDARKIVPLWTGR